MLYMFHLYSYHCNDDCMYQHNYHNNKPYSRHNQCFYHHCLLGSLNDTHCYNFDYIHHCNHHNNLIYNQYIHQYKIDNNYYLNIHYYVR